MRGKKRPLRLRFCSAWRVRKFAHSERVEAHAGRCGPARTTVMCFDYCRLYGCKFEPIAFVISRMDVMS
jgi:hypothetical protein